jgi:hypothetical protein
MLAMLTMQAVLPKNLVLVSTSTRSRPLRGLVGLMLLDNVTPVPSVFTYKDLNLFS